jgi:hypothetical protein
VKVIDSKGLYARGRTAPSSKGKNNAAQPSPEFVRFRWHVGFIAPPMCLHLAGGLPRRPCETIDFVLRRD